MILKHSKAIAVVAASTLCLAMFAAVGGTGQAAMHAKKATAPTYSAVQPIFQAKCVGCHNSTHHAHGVDLSSYKSIMAGGKGGSIVVPGHPEKSDIVLYTDGSHQPRMPFRGAPLDDKSIHLIGNWVKAGAKD